MKKDKLANLECNLSRLNSNIENYNKLDIKYKDTVEELTELKDYVKSVDGYIGDLEGKIDQLVEIPKQQERRLSMLAENVHKMSCLIKPPPIEEFNRIEKQSQSIKPQIEMFKRNIEESRKRIESKIGTVLKPNTVSEKPLACPKVKDWGAYCDEKGNLVQHKPKPTQLALPAPKSQPKKTNPTKVKRTSSSLKVKKTLRKKTSSSKRNKKNISRSRHRRSKSIPRPRRSKSRSRHRTTPRKSRSAPKCRMVCSRN